MSQLFLAEVRIVSFGFAPKGGALCNGQLLPINQNQALFSLLETTYGGDGVRTFQLPNLQASMPIHVGNGFAQGQAGGVGTVGCFLPRSVDSSTDIRTNEPCDLLFWLTLKREPIQWFEGLTGNPAKDD
jgi:hypothetical protein